MCLLDLPVELLAEALAYLDHRHLLLVREAITLTAGVQVCRDLRDAVDNTARLCYMIELAREHMQNGSRADLGSADRLQKLREYRQAWRALNWSANKKVPDGGVFAIAGDIIACTKRTDATYITFTRMGSKLRGVDEQQWTIDAPQGLRDFVIEPVMDLVVALTERECPHPLATQPVIQVPLTFVAADFKPMIYGDRLGVLFTSHSLSYTYFTVWNWQTGEEYKRPFRKRRVPSATFLDKDLVAMPFTCYNKDNRMHSALLVADISVPSKPRRVCRLLLPPALPDITLFADFIWDQPLSHNAERPRSGWFAPVPEERILGLSISGFDAVSFGILPPTTAMFILSATRITARIRQRMTGSETDRITLEWADWGPDCTRVFPHTCPALWLSFIHGTRYALLDDDDAPPAGYAVYDFSRAAVDEAAEEDPDDDSYVVSEPSIFNERGAFGIPIETRLPYRYKWRELGPEVTNWIGEQGSESASVMLIDDGVVFSPDAGGEYWAWTL
ncbi:hypothetical protein HDZ31DRAFT_38172 [Schizophyllum fasciatum]